MPNRNYNRGANFERKVKKVLEDYGYFVIRAAGSHTPADLVAIIEVLGEPYVGLIQCKIDGKISKKEKGALIKVARIAGGDEILAYRPKTRGIAFTALVDGSDWDPEVLI